MKTLLSLLLAMLLTVTAIAERDPTIYVSITDKTGALVLAYAPVTLTDADKDGSLTMNDALICAHATYHPSGTEAYFAEVSEFGMSMVRLWGVENGGSYGYCINDVSAMNPLDPVVPGDHVKAYTFTDLTAWSDLYGFFDAVTIQAAAGVEVSLTLSVNAFDENWMPVVLPLEGAVLTIDGEPTSAITDEAGQATLTFDAPGVYTVSATSDSVTLVAPVCIVTVE